MFVFVFLCCVVLYVSRGLCEKVITHPKVSYHVSSKTEKPKKGRLGPCIDHKSYRW
jgi:hypothetical protein